MRLVFALLLFMSCSAVHEGAGLADEADPVSRRWLRAGKVAFLRGDFEEAERCFLHAAGCAEGAYWMGRVLCAERRFGEARKYFDAAAEHFGGWRRVDALMWAADCAMWFHDFVDAARRYGDLLRMGAEPAEDVRLKLATALLRSGAWDEAAAQFKKLLCSASTRDVEELANRGLFFCGRKHFAIQVAAFKRAKSAQRLVEDLKKQGLNAYTVLYPDGPIYLVWIGRYGSFLEASEALSRIRRQERFEEAFVVP